MRGAFGAHPGGKSFVEPKVVPPCHRHEVAEPLVRHFVRETPHRYLALFLQRNSSDQTEASIRNR